MANVFLGSVYANLELRDSGWSSNITNAQKNIKNFNNTTSEAANGSERFSARFAAAMGVVSGIAATAANKAISLISNSIGDAIKRVDTLHASAKTFEYMGFASEASARATDLLKKSILGLPTPLDAAMRGMTALAATYGDVELGQKIFTSLNNAILGFGGTTDMVNNAITQLSQLPMDGPLDAQTWMSLRNSGLTPVLVSMAKDMGMGVNEMKEAFGSGQLKVSDFTRELIKMNTEGGGGLASLEKIAKNATSGIGTGMENMKTAVTRGVAAIIDAVGQSNISSAISNIGDSFEKALKAVATAVPPVLNAISGLFGFINQNKTLFQTLTVAILAGVAAWKVYTTTMAVVKAATTAYMAVSRGLSLVMALQAQGLGIARAAWIALGIAMNANPIGLIITAIAAVVAALVFLQLKFNIFGKAFEALKPIFKAVGDFFMGVFSAVGNFFTSIFNGVASFFQKWGKVIIAVFAVLFAPIVAPIIAIIAIVKNWQTIMNVLGTVISTVFTAIAAVYNATLKPVFDGIIYVVTAIGTVVWTIFSGIVQVITTVVSTIAQIIGVVLYGTFMWLWNNVLTPTGKFFASVFSGIVSVVTLYINTVLTIIRTVMSAVWGFLQPILSTIGGFFSSVWNGILSVVSTVVNTIRNVVTSVFNGVKSAISSILNGVKDIIIKPFSDALNWIKGIVGSFLQAGKDIIDGIVKGVVNGKDAVVNKIKDICKGALDAVKNFFGIKSPSRVMAKMFGFVVGGGVKGLDDNAQKLKDAFSSTFNMLPDLIAEPTVNATVGYANQAVASLRPQEVAAGASSQTNIYGDIHVESRNDDETVLDQLDRGVVLSGRGMVAEA